MSELVKRRVKKRKTPYKHPVKEHRRKGNPVQKYERGKGDQAKKKSKRRSRVVGGGSVPSGYGVAIYYFDDRSERFGVGARNYVGALGYGLEQRDAVSPVHLIRIRRDR